MDGDMKRLVLAILAGAALYSAFWVWSARDLREQVEAAMAGMRAEGMGIEYEALALRGFPSRLDLTFEGLTVTAPDGLRIETPLVQALQTVWQRDRWIVVLPSQITLTGTTPDPVTLWPDGLRASLGTELVLEADALRLGSGATDLTAGPVLLAVRPEDDGAYRLFLRATALRATPGPDAAELVLDGTLTFARALALPAILPLPELMATEITTLNEPGTATLAEALRPAFPGLAGFLDQRQ